MYVESISRRLYQYVRFKHGTFLLSRSHICLIDRSIFVPRSTLNRAEAAFSSRNVAAASSATGVGDRGGSIDATVAAAAATPVGGSGLCGGASWMLPWLAGNHPCVVVCVLN
jgi:hypothetical protein